jgi:Na+/H+-translocating membrane pyrophosphatase
MTVGGGAFGVTVGGTGISLAAGSINIDAGSYENVSFNGQTLTPLQMFENEVQDIYDAIDAVQSAVDALGPCACP